MIEPIFVFYAIWMADIGFEVYILFNESYIEKSFDCNNFSS